MTTRIEQSYTKGVHDALEKLAFGEMLSKLLTNPNKVKAAKGMKGSSTGNLGSDITKAIGAGNSTPPPPPTTGG
jgi:hypothetical protein